MSNRLYIIIKNQLFYFLVLNFVILGCNDLKSNEHISENNKKVNSDTTNSQEVFTTDSNQDATISNKSVAPSISTTKIKDSSKVLLLPDHSKFNELLNKNVSVKGKVNYKGILSNKEKLDDYLKYLSEFTAVEKWEKRTQLAFWVNLYNASTIQLVLNNYPVSSIKEIENGSPWDKIWIKANGKTYSLNQIENSIIRPQFKDPRIHFVLNCAAKSCPPLLNRAFTSEYIYSSMEKRTTDFINSSQNFISSEKIEISKLFEWYAEDFGNVKTFINKYVDIKLTDTTVLEYKEYDWSLNE